MVARSRLFWLLSLLVLLACHPGMAQQARPDRVLLANRLQLLTLPSNTTGAYALHLLLKLPKGAGEALAAYSDALASLISSPSGDDRSPAAGLDKLAGELGLKGGQVVVLSGEYEFFELLLAGPEDSFPTALAFVTQLFSLAPPSQDFVQSSVIPRTSQRLFESLSVPQVAERLAVQNLTGGYGQSTTLASDAVYVAQLMTADDLYNFYSSTFSADKTLIAVVGSFDGKALEGALKTIPLRPVRWQTRPAEETPVQLPALLVSEGPPMAEVTCAWEISLPSLAQYASLLVLAQQLSTGDGRLDPSLLAGLPLPDFIKAVLARTQRMTSLAFTRKGLLLSITSASDPRVLKESYEDVVASLAQAKIELQTPEVLTSARLASTNKQALGYPEPADLARHMVRMEACGLTGLDVFSVQRACAEVTPTSMETLLASFDPVPSAVVMVMPGVGNGEGDEG